MLFTTQPFTPLSTVSTLRPASTTLIWNGKQRLNSCIGQYMVCLKLGSIRRGKRHFMHDLQNVCSNYINYQLNWTLYLLWKYKTVFFCFVFLMPWKGCKGNKHWYKCVNLGEGNHSTKSERSHSRMHIFAVPGLLDKQILTYYHNLSWVTKSILDLNDCPVLQCTCQWVLRQTRMKIHFLYAVPEVWHFTKLFLFHDQFFLVV